MGVKTKASKEVILPKAADTTKKPRLVPGFSPSWKLAMEWMAFQPCNTTTASCYSLEHLHDSD